MALPRQAQRAAKPLRQHALQPRAQRRIELRHAGLENDRLRRQTLFVLADHKQHPRRALKGRRDHGGLARNRVTKSTFVVLISIVNATSDQSGVRRLKKMTCVYFATLLSIRKAWQRAAAGAVQGSAARASNRALQGAVPVAATRQSGQREINHSGSCKDWQASVFGSQADLTPQFLDARLEPLKIVPGG